jgi:hypothetical protein
MSSLSFLGNATSYLRIPNTNDLNFRTGDFTIEWYQYQTDSNPYPRIFQLGNYADEEISIGVSIELREDEVLGEGGRFYYWTSGNTISDKFLASSSYKNQWVHFAICRASGVTNVYMNGTSIYEINNDTTDFNGRHDLTIGNESPPISNGSPPISNDTAFGGDIKYFTWVKGVALYNGNFTVPTNYPTLTNNYVLLLTASSFTGTLGSAVVNYNVLPPINAPSNRPNLTNLKPLFTNNAQVYYKPGSLAPGGVGSVRNSSIKARKT